MNDYKYLTDHYDIKIKSRTWMLWRPDDMGEITWYRHFQVRSTHMWGIETYNEKTKSGNVYIYSYRTLVMKLDYSTRKNRKHRCTGFYTEYFDEQYYRVTPSTRRQLTWIQRIIRDVWVDTYSEQRFKLIPIQYAPFDPTKNGAYMGE